MKEYCCLSRYICKSCENSKVPLSSKRDNRPNSVTRNAQIHVINALILDDIQGESKNEKPRTKGSEKQEGSRDGGAKRTYTHFLQVWQIEKTLTKLPAPRAESQVFSACDSLLEEVVLAHPNTERWNYPCTHQPTAAKKLVQPRVKRRQSFRTTNYFSRHKYPTPISSRLFQTRFLKETLNLFSKIICNKFNWIF